MNKKTTINRLNAFLKSDDTFYTHYEYEFMNYFYE